MMRRLTRSLPSSPRNGKVRRSGASTPELANFASFGSPRQIVSALGRPARARRSAARHIACSPARPTATTGGNSVGMGVGFGVRWERILILSDSGVRGEEIEGTLRVADRAQASRVLDNGG